VTIISTLDLKPEHSFDCGYEATKGTYNLYAPRKHVREMRFQADLSIWGDLVLSDFVCQKNIKQRDTRNISRTLRHT
jgi:hypothetical protein